MKEAFVLLIVSTGLHLCWSATIPGAGDGGDNLPTQNTTKSTPLNVSHAYEASPLGELIDVLTSPVRGLLNTWNSPVPDTASAQERFDLSLSVSALESCNVRGSCEGRCGDNRKIMTGGVSCNCDDMCSNYGDCCLDYNILCNATGVEIRRLSFQCTAPTISSTRSPRGFYLVKKCPEEWSGDSKVKELCENGSSRNEWNNSHDPLLHLRVSLPVLVPSTSKHYLNQYCAKCNGYTDYYLWQVHISCSDTLDMDRSTRQVIEVAVNSSSCDVTLVPPTPSYTHPHQCWSTVVDTCSNTSNVFMEECEAYTNYIEIDEVVYKNVHCALCNDVHLQDMKCGLPTFRRYGKISDEILLDKILDFNTHKLEYRKGTDNSSESGGNGDDGKCPCEMIPYKRDECVPKMQWDRLSLELIAEVHENGERVGEMEDMVIKELTATLNEHIQLHGSSVNLSLSINKVSKILENKVENNEIYLLETLIDQVSSAVPMIEDVDDDPMSMLHNMEGHWLDVIGVQIKLLEGGEVKHVHRCMLVPLPQDVSIPEHDNIYMLHTEPFICEDVLDSIGPITQPVWLTTCTTCISVLSLATLLVTFTLYALITELKASLPGRNILNITAAMFLGQILYLTHPYYTDISTLCWGVAILIHYFFLAVFAWLSAAIYSLYTTFQSIASYGQSVSRQSFVKNALYSWGGPLLIIIPCIITDLIAEDIHIGYGGINTLTYTTTCWMTDVTTMMLVLALPLLIVITSNLAFFLRTLYVVRQSHLEPSHRESRMLSNSWTAELRKQAIATHTYANIYAVCTAFLAITWFLSYLPYVSSFNNATKMSLLIVSEIAMASQGLFLAITLLNSTTIRHELIKKLFSRKA